MNKLDEIYSKHENVAEFSSAYFQHIMQTIAKIDVNEVAKFVELVVRAKNKNNTIYFLGNGGSASTASHFANDLSIGTRSWEKPFKVVSLCDNNSIITAIANDYGYEDVFLLQLKTCLKKDDVVVAISASGNSPNLLKAITYANEVGATTVGLTAFDGGKLKKLCHQGVHVPTDLGEYGPAEDAHMIIDHLMNSYLSRLVKAEDSKETSRDKTALTQA